MEEDVDNDNEEEELQVNGSSKKYKFMYPDEIHMEVEDCEEEDDMVTFANIFNNSTANKNNIKLVHSMLLNVACAKCYESCRSNLGKQNARERWVY